MYIFFVSLMIDLSPRKESLILAGPQGVASGSPQDGAGSGPSRGSATRGMGLGYPVAQGELMLLPLQAGCLSSVGSEWQHTTERVLQS